MANEFKIKKGLIVTGASGGTVVDIQGSQGQLFSVTDDLSGSIFAVSDISGVPILDVNSSGLSTFDGDVNLPDNKKILLGTGNDIELYHNGTHSHIINNTGDLTIDSQGDDLLLKAADDLLLYVQGNEVALQAIGNAGVKIRYNNVVKFETTNTGVSVSGGLTVSGTNSFLIESNNTAATFNLNSTARGFDFINNNATLLNLDSDGNGTFADQAFATTATSSGDASSTLTTKGYVDSLITGATIYRGAWQAGISATSSAATTASTTLTVTAAILDADGNTPVLVGAVVTGEGITGIVKVASVTSSTVYVLDTAIDATATAYIFSPIHGAPSLDGVTQTSGYYYICSEAGSATPNGANSEPNTWNVGDWCIYNDVSGTGQWQKIDNSSVLSGAGTGQTVALWEGPSSVTDSDTLGNAPITVSGSDTTFTGSITAKFATSSAMLNLYNTTNGNGSTIRFSDQTAQTQVGDITFYHSDGSSQGGGASWHFTSQPDTVLVVGSSTVTGRFVAKSAGSATEVDYGFYDDVNTGMYRAGADTLAFSTAGTERMRINSAGAIKFNAYGAGTLVTDASGNITVSSGGGAGGPYLPLAGGTMTGNLNINTSTNFPLLITGTNATYTAMGIRNTGTGDAGIYMDGINGDFGGSDYAFIGQKDEGYLLYNIGANSPLPYHVFTGGNVGIGVTSPTSKLHVSAASSNSQLTLERTGSAPGKYQIYTNTNNLYVNNLVANSFPLTILNSGNVGIGTTIPTAKLHVDGDLIITDTPQGQGDFLTVNPISGKVTTVSSKDISFGEAYINNYRSRVLDYGGTYFPTGAAGNVAKHKTNNLFNLMSMMLLPGGVFSGKITAAKPKTGVNFTWTRTTVANYTNEEGVITEAPIATPRIDYANNSNGEILIEPTRTNLVPNSGPGNYGNSPGSSTTVPGPNGVYDSAIVPVPNATADRYQYAIAANTHSDGDVFMYSWYRRRLSTPVQDTYVGDLSIQGLINCTQTGTTTQIESNISGFDRFACEITLTLGNTQALVRGYFGAIVGIGNSSIAYFGQQLELGNFATTLINTTGNTVTRDNDYMIVNNLSDTIFQGMVGQGGMYMDFDYKREGGADGLRFYDENNITPRVYLYQGVTGISDSWNAGNFTLNQTSGNKIGYMFTSTTSAVYCANGANVVTSSPTAAAALDTPLDTLYIDGNQNLIRIRELSMFTQMTSAQLVTLTSL